MLDREGRISTTPAAATRSRHHPVVPTSSSTGLAYLVAELHVDGFPASTCVRFGTRHGRQGAGRPAAIAAHRGAPRPGGDKAAGRPWTGGPVAAGQVPGLGRWAEFNGWFRDDVRRFVARVGPRPRRQRVFAASTSTARHRATPHHSLNFVTVTTAHALGSGLVQPQAQPGQRREQQGRWDDKPQLATTPRGADARQATSTPSASGRRATSYAAAISAGRPFLTQGDEFRPHQRGKTTPIARIIDCGRLVRWPRRTPGLLVPRG